MFFADRDDCVKFRKYLIFENNDLYIIICNGIMDEINKQMSQKHLGFNLLYHHIIIPLTIRNKIDENGIESNIPNDCKISHKNDIHVVKCAIGSKCNKIITLDSRLTINPECQIEIRYISDYISC